MKAFRNLFKRMLKSAFWYVIAFALTMLTLEAIFKFIKTDSAIGFPNWIEQAKIISETSGLIYMLTSGIVCPLIYFGQYISAGATRGNFALAQIASGIALSICLALLKAPMQALDGSFTAIGLIASIVHGAFAFVAGWSCSAGFLYMRAIPISLGAIGASALWYGFFVVEALQIPLWATLAILAFLTLVSSAILLLAVRRMPIKS